VIQKELEAARRYVARNDSTTSGPRIKYASADQFRS